MGRRAPHLKRTVGDILLYTVLNWLSGGHGIGMVLSNSILYNSKVIISLTWQKFVISWLKF